MLQDLTRLLEKSYLKVRDEEVQSLHDKIAELQSRNEELLEELAEVKYKRDTLESNLKSALDEIVRNQKRIDALLRQLSEKNGGKQTR